MGAARRKRWPVPVCPLAAERALDCSGRQGRPTGRIRRGQAGAVPTGGP
jgi:hypothetical protein